MNGRSGIIPRDFLSTAALWKVGFTGFSTLNDQAASNCTIAEIVNLNMANPMV